MSIMQLPLQEILDRLQVNEMERDEYDELVFNYIIPLLEISSDNLKNMDIDRYYLPICKKIKELKEDKKILDNLKTKYTIVSDGMGGWII